MDRALVYERLNRVFRDVFDDDSLCISEKTTAKDIAGWDSLNHIRLMIAVSKSFGVKFSAAQIGSMKNVGDLVALIIRKGAK